MIHQDQFRQQLQSVRNKLSQQLQWLPQSRIIFHSDQTRLLRGLSQSSWKAVSLSLSKNFQLTRKSRKWRNDGKTAQKWY